MALTLWELEDVSLAGAPTPRLAGVSLSILPGVTAVMGNSGAGKTSLLNLLVGFEKATRGSVKVGVAKTASGGAALPYYWAPAGGGLWPHATVRRHLEMVSPGRGGTRSVDEWLRVFDLEQVAGAMPDRLSQGERARLAVARALATHASVLVMDEPLVHVDATRANDYWRVVREHLAATGSSLVFSTHEPERALLEAQRVVCLEAGRVIYSGEVEELYDRPATRELAECLGHTNWLTPGEAALWLAQEWATARSVRPEKIDIVKAKANERAELVVSDARFAGSVGEVELRHAASGATKRFLHRPGGVRLRAGDAVWLRVCMLIALCLFAVGCGDASGASGATGGELKFSSVEYLSTPSDEARVPSPRGVTWKSGETYVIDTAARIFVYDENRALVRQWRMPEWSVGKPESLCPLRDGRIAVPDTHYHRVVFFDKDGKVLSMLGSFGMEHGQFVYPVSMTQDDKENLYVCEYGDNDRVQKFTRDGEFILQFGGFGTGGDQFQRPSGIVWHAGLVYVADAINNRIQVFREDGKHVGVLGAGLERQPAFHLPYDLSLGPDKNLYVVEYGGGCVTKVDLSGRVLGRFGRTGAGEGEFSTPWGISVDAKGVVRVADTGNRRLVELKP